MTQRTLETTVGLFVLLGIVCLAWLVITSYSIHYTKLYEWEILLDYQCIDMVVQAK